MLKIIPITDLHLDKGNNLELFKQLIRNILKYASLQEVKPIVVCCGDLSDSPTDTVTVGEKQVNIFDYIKSVFDSLNVAGVSTYISPGNHDVAKRGIYYREKHHERFYKTLIKTIPTVQYAGNPDTQRKPVLLVGIDSCYGFDDTCLAAGEVTDKQLDHLEQAIVNNDPFREALRIGYLHHHVIAHYDHPDAYGMELNDSKELIKMLKHQRINLVFHGHRHSYQGSFRVHGTDLLIYTPGSLKDSLFDVLTLDTATGAVTIQRGVKV